MAGSRTAVLEVDIELVAKMEAHLAGSGETLSDFINRKLASSCRHEGRVHVPLSSLAVRRLAKLAKEDPDLNAADFLAWLPERELREVAPSPLAEWNAVAFGMRRRSFFAVADFLERTATEQEERDAKERTRRLAR